MYKYRMKESNTQWVLWKRQVSPILSERVYRGVEGRVKLDELNKKGRSDWVTV